MLSRPPRGSKSLGTMLFPREKGHKMEVEGLYILHTHSSLPVPQTADKQDRLKLSLGGDKTIQKKVGQEKEDGKFCPRYIHSQHKLLPYCGIF